MHLNCFRGCPVHCVESTARHTFGATEATGDTASRVNSFKGNPFRKQRHVRMSGHKGIWSSIRMWMLGQSISRCESWNSVLPITSNFNTKSIDCHTKGFPLTIPSHAFAGTLSDTGSIAYQSAWSQSQSQKPGQDSRQSENGVQKGSTVSNLFFYQVFSLQPLVPSVLGGNAWPLIQHELFQFWVGAFLEAFYSCLYIVHGWIYLNDRKAKKSKVSQSNNFEILGCKKKQRHATCYTSISCLYTVVEIA